jgi:hypothetical protein
MQRKFSGLMKQMRIYHRGVTLIEALVAAVMVSVIALGGLAYQYFGAAHFRIAHAELTATRASQLLLEDWKGSGATNPVNYDANSLGLGFAGAGSDYNIAIDGVKMFMHLSYQDVEVDNDAGITLRELKVKTQWCNSGSGTPGAGDPSLVLTTYARRGQD